MHKKYTVPAAEATVIGVITASGACAEDKASPHSFSGDVTLTTKCVAWGTGRTEFGPVIRRTPKDTRSSGLYGGGAAFNPS